MTFCARVVELSVTQRSKNSSRGEKTCERTQPAEEKARCFMCLGYRVQWWQLVIGTEVVKDFVLSH